MSPVLHPVGPEPTRVYWARRAAVIAVFLAVVAVILALVGHATGGRQPVAAVPAVPTPTTTRSVPPTVPATATPSASKSASGSSPSMSASTKPKASATPTSPVKPTSSSTSTSSSKPSSSAKPSAQPTARAAVPPCLPAQVRTTLTGKKVLDPGEANTFEISLINGTAVTCRMSVRGGTFELKIYSGKDRIWSSDDCSTAVKRISKIVASEKSIGWTMTWNGRRSAQDCKNREETPRAGTYFATAQLTGAEPVQLRMILR